MTRALVLSGGGIKGAYEAGAMQAIFEAGYFPDVIVGISTGALSGAFIVDRIGRTTSSPEAEHWRAAAAALTDFYITRVTGPASIARKRSKLSLVWHTATGSGFDGLTDSAPLWSLINGTIEEKNLQRVADTIQLEVGAVDLVSGTLDYQNANNNPCIVRHIYASTAMPIVMPIVYEGSVPYYDGGICETAPIGRAIDLGADEIVSIVCQAPDLREGKLNPGNVFELVGRLADVTSYRILRNDLEQVALINRAIQHCGTTTLSVGPNTYRTVKWKRIEPDRPLNVSIDNFSTKDINYMIDFGRRSGQAVMQQDWLTG